MKTALTSMKFWLALGASVLFGLGVSVRAAGTPELMIETPAPDQTIEGSTVTVQFAPSNFTLTDYQTKSRAVSGQGHIHLWLDQTDLSKSSAIKLTANTYTFTDVPTGEHTVVAELVNNDHTSLKPPVTATVTFTTTAVMTQSNFADNTFLFAILAFILLAIALYFVNMQRHVTTKSHSATRARSSSAKSSKSRRSR